jgi:hypothetical protein
VSPEEQAKRDADRKRRQEEEERMCAVVRQEMPPPFTLGQVRSSERGGQTMACRCQPVLCVRQNVEHCD